MKFQCASCGLRIDSLHFKQQGLINPKLTSICDICIQRGQDPEDYANAVIAIFAQNLLYSFVGQKIGQIDESQFFINNKKARKRYEAFIQDYDANDLATSQIDRGDFNQAVIASEAGQLGYVPDQGITFAQNLEKMGLEVNFSLDDVDYIDRERIRAKYHYRCQYCGRYGRSVDHKDPVSLSHNNHLDNLILSCAECNRIKSNMPYELFTKLNDQLADLNKQLVKYEQTLNTLKGEFEERKRKVAAKMHLKGVVNDPDLDEMRKENKRLQDAIDSLESDYDSLRKLRENYFVNGWKIEQEKKKEDII